MKKFNAFFSFFILSTFSLFEIAVHDKDKIFEELSRKYSNLRSIKVEFRSEDLRLDGVLTATSEGKYRLLLKSDGKIARILVSDSKTLWNYSPKENKVVISSIETNDELSLQNFFVTFADKFVPLSYTKETSSRFGSRYLLMLTKKNNENEKIGIYLNEKKEITSIIFILQEREEKYLISKIRINPKITDKFEFKIPEGSEVIDLR
ncbi:MAG: hypothetical protein N2517_08895 [Ignavibacteria bacterium]|nr:hypothetical protein [Ignavibacteria bacterium]